MAHRTLIAATSVSLLALAGITAAIADRLEETTYVPYEHKSIQYFETPTNEAVKRLDDGIDQGKVKLDFVPGGLGYLPSLLKQLGLNVDSQVLIYIHKELALDDVVARYPAQHYVLVDDKPRILAAVKDAWGDRVTTVLPRQGQYAHDAKTLASSGVPDITVERIGDLLTCDLASLVAGDGWAQCHVEMPQ